MAAEQMRYTPGMDKRFFVRVGFIAVSVAVVALVGGARLGAQSVGAAPAPTADRVRLSFGDLGAYRMVERSDWARYDDGKYVGHVYREVRGSLSGRPAAVPGAVPGAVEYYGEFFVLEETLRDMTATARSLDDIVPAVFRINADGSFAPIKDEGFPSLRGFPAFPVDPVGVGTKWTARFVRAADPRNDGNRVLLPLIAEFEYRGIETYKETPVHRVFAKYAVRHRAPAGPSPRVFTGASGTHEVDILLRVADGLPLLMRDRLDETFTFPDASSVRFKGFTLTFSEGVPPGGRGSVIASLRGSEAGGPAATADSGAASGAESGAEEPGTPPAMRDADAAASRAGTEGPLMPEETFELAGSLPGGAPLNVSVEETDAGVRLTVNDLRFAADSDALLPQERPRLEALAETLRKIQGRTFLVEGHTAAVGKPSGELELSVRRAKRIVDELVARGIPADSFLYKGWGGTRPVAANETEADRARNRRVEITILD